MLRIARVLLFDSCQSVLIRKVEMFVELGFFDEGLVCAWPECRYYIDRRVLRYSVSVVSYIRS